MTIFECGSVVQNSVGVVGLLNASHLLPGLVCVSVSEKHQEHSWRTA